MKSAMGLDLGLTCTGYTILEPGPRFVTLGAVRPPKTCADAQAKADFITDHVLKVVFHFNPGEIWIEEKIANAWGRQEGRRQRATNPASAMAKGQLVGAVRGLLRAHGRNYKLIAVKRHRRILGLKGLGKDEFVKATRDWFRDKGAPLPEKCAADVVEAAGVAAAGLVAMDDPSVLEPGWNPPRPKKCKKLPPGQRTLGI